MTGLTTEINSITEALNHIYRECVQTHGRPPTTIFLGPLEYCEFSKNFTKIHSHRFLDVPVEVGEIDGIHFEYSAKSDLN